MKDEIGLTINIVNGDERKLTRFKEGDYAERLVDRVLELTATDQISWRGEGLTALSQLTPGIYVAYRGDEPGVYAPNKTLYVVNGGQRISIELDHEGVKRFNELLDDVIKSGVRKRDENLRRTKDIVIKNTLMNIGGMTDGE